MTLNDEAKFLFGACLPVLCLFTLLTWMSGDSFALPFGFLAWLIVGASLLFVRYNFPRIVVAQLPQETFLKGLFVFGSWLLWPVWALRLPVQP